MHLFNGLAFQAVGSYSIRPYLGATAGIGQLGLVLSVSLAQKLPIFVLV
jgi:hypothetical protein